MFTIFTKHLKDKKLIGFNERSLLCVSGGIDSMVLLHLFNALDFDFEVAHVDHMTRHGQSTIDAEFVKTYCEKNGIGFHLKTLDYNADDINNFQSYFREERYAFFHSLGHDKIITAHHSDDHLETIFINFFSGKSVHGIPEINGKIVRPLLVFSKAQIVAYAKENDVPYIEDATNAESQYFRNFIRHEILPKLFDKDQNLKEKVEALSSKSVDNERLIESLSQTLLNPKEDKIDIQLDKSLVKSNDPLLLFHFIKKYGFTLTVAKNICTSIENTGALFHSKTHTILIDRAFILITQNSKEFLPIEIDLAKMPIKIKAGKYTLVFEKTEGENINIDNSKSAFFAIDKLRNKLKVRNWKHGDSFKPAGMHGKSQTLKKFFTNNKVNRLEKKQIPLLLNDQEIIWIAGMCVHEDYKAYNNSEVLSVSLLEPE